MKNAFNQRIDLQSPDYTLVNQAIFELTNKERLAHDLTAFTHNSQLETAAWYHSKSMGQRNFFDHINNRERMRKEPSDRARLAGVKNPMISENIAYVAGYRFSDYYDLAAHFVDGWMNSPPHRKNLLSPDALQLGCGVYYYKGVYLKNNQIHHQGDGSWIATQNFQLYRPVVPGKARDRRPDVKEIL